MLYNGDGGNSMGNEIPVAEVELNQEWLTVQEVARFLYVHPNTIRKWSDQGVLKCYRVGPRHDRRFRPRDVLSIIQENQT